MRHSALIIIMLLSMLMMQGCEQGRDLQPQDYFEGTQLAIAKTIYEGERQKLNAMLPTVSKETLNRPAKAEMTLLFWAINNAIFDKNTPERLKIITDLVKAGADPLQPQPNTPGSPAEFVMKADKGVWIQAMLEGGLSPNARDKVHNQPIIFESFDAANTETLKMLIAYQVDVDIKGAMNRTPLINALYNSCPEHIEVLLAHGANPLAKDDFNDSFLSLISAEIAKGDKNNSYIKKLIKIKEKINIMN
ncbi:ankyrin repeat domain-containing protein [Serratia marcescens]|uniref:ankyrin repeat domain-containing protein n=1 Tax=Serratia TaxID=613 RepID=UPI0018D9F7CF|nr:ankyrin repeat domain-containing protein [Serratia marcescens]MBH2922472.1 ankyrin repeat domain-containing protein [Serratia marcescens]MBH3028066.1 ankyrin repeat domain-containing protein [Serratia marcescens]MBH3042486.1 ankyrin repeat domain-containing protein [Serratia marcescens]MBH3295843.1 ankyrin repeat domain-containing protein [Serratia marcescens]CAI2075787.1 Ankyrin repeat [Serratia marcescens]